MKKALKIITKILMVISLLFVLLLVGIFVIIYWPKPYNCSGYDDNRVDIEGCYYKQLKRAADDKNMEQRINFMHELSDYYSYYYSEEVGKEFLEATYSLCKYAKMVPKEPDMSPCSDIRSELGGPSMPMSEENKKLIQKYMDEKSKPIKNK